MADERDPRVSKRYRELGGEEPPRELDQTILAAAHRAAGRAHAPLVAPGGRHRWYFAFGAAAILVLAVAVTVQVERQQPDPEAIAVAPAIVPSDRGEGVSSYREPPPAVEPRKDTKQAEPQKRVEPRKPQPPEQRPRFARERAPVQEAPPELARDPTPATPPPASVESQVQQSAGVVARAEVQSAPPPSPSTQSPQPESREQSPAADAAPDAGLMANRIGGARMREAPPVAKPAPAPQGRADSRVAASAIPLSPERLLERIAELRNEGRHDEADRLLAEFRERYPDYRISEEMLKKVERKK
jgi:hypothetical protein